MMCIGPKKISCKSHRQAGSLDAPNEKWKCFVSRTIKLDFTSDCYIEAKASIRSNYGATSGGYHKNVSSGLYFYCSKISRETRHSCMRPRRSKNARCTVLSMFQSVLVSLLHASISLCLTQ
jgi:hypothetical protein